MADFANVRYKLQGSHLVIGSLILCAFLLVYNLGTPRIPGDVIVPRHDSSSTERGNSVESVNVEPQVSKTPFDWISLFSFVPNGLKKCQYLFENRKYLGEPFIFDVQAHKREVDKFSNIEGNSALRIEQYLSYVKLAESTFINTVCETGFNAGHSTLVWLSINPKTHVYSFDLGIHDYARPMADYLQQRFPGRLNVTWGDSTLTLPEFHRKHPEVKCDLLVIDGGHTNPVCQSDYDVFRTMANKENLVILDNYPDTRLNWMEDLGNVWERARRRGELNEIFSCSFLPEDPQGFSVGRFIF